MGQVFLCEDRGLARQVAVKFIRSLEEDAELLERFTNEARAIARLSHPNVVAVYRLGQLRERPYLVSEYIRGRSLDAVNLPLPWTEVLRIGSKLAAGLAVAHKQLVLHRDIKPANIMQTEEGEIKLLDFGLAKLLDSPSNLLSPPSPQGQEGSAAVAPVADIDVLGATVSGGEQTPSSHAAVLSATASWSASEPSPTTATGGRAAQDARRRLTQTGSLLGTPFYMAPEIWRGEAATAACDIYSLGAVLYELTLGAPPHNSPTIAALSDAAKHQDVTPLGNLVPAANPHFCAIVDRCLQRDAATRYATAIELSAELDKLAQTVSHRSARATSPRPWRRGIVALLAGLTVAAGSYAGWRISRRAPDYITITGGTFRMGSSAKESKAAYEWCLLEGKEPCIIEQYQREQPQREVTVSTFRVARTETTTAEYVDWLNSQKNLKLHDGKWVYQGAVPIANIYPTIRTAHGVTYDEKARRYGVLAGYERKPISQVTWFGAWRYCEARGMRLPTEAEWEYTARGSSQRRFPWGNEEPSCSDVVLARGEGLICAQAAVGPQNVGTASLDVTPAGIHDLAGNVSEWVQDVFVPGYQPCNSVCIDPVVWERPLGPFNGTEVLRCVRGGSWPVSRPAGRASARSHWNPMEAPINIGFRCAASVAKK